MNYYMYLDESHQTGNPKLINGQWNWYSPKDKPRNDRPYFSLGSVCIKEINEKGFEEGIKNILKKYDPKLGSENELKSTANYKFKEELISDFIELLKSTNAIIYIDIVDKKFNIVKYISEFCIYPWYLNEEYKGTVSLRSKKVNVATLLYNVLPDEIIAKYIVICETKLDEETMYKNLIQYIKEISLYIDDNELKVQMEFVLSSIENYKERGLEIEHLYPIKDKTNKGGEMCFLPNLDSYLNLVSSIRNLKITGNDKIYIYHDEQKQFDQSIKRWTKTLEEDLNNNGYRNFANINKLEFIDSKLNLAIQLVDFITGTAVKCFTKCVDEKHLDYKSRNIIKIMKPILMNCNIVCPKNKIFKFHDKCDLESVNTPLPI